MFKNYYKFLTTFLFKKHRLFVVITFLLTIISGLLSGLGIGLYIPVINQFVSTTQSLDIFSRLSNQCLSYINLSPSLYNLVFLATVTIILGASLTYVTMLCSGYLCRYTIMLVKDRLTKDLLDRNYQYFMNTKIGEIVTVLTDQATVACQSVHIIFRLFTNLILAIACIISLLLISDSLTLVMTVFGVFILSTNQYFVRKVQELSQLWQEIKFEQANLFTETMIGIKTIKAMGTENFRLGEIGDSLEYERINVFKLHNYHNMRPFLNTVFAILFASTSILLGIKFFKLPGADVIVFLMVTGRLSGTLQEVNGSWVELARSLPSTQIVLQYVNWNKIREPEKPKIPFHFNECIKLENVSFYYEGYGKVLRNINLPVFKKQFIGLVGPSGGGKSTLIDIILGIINPTQGQILFDGKPLESYSYENWCRSIGVVSQDVFLFNDTLLNNIAYGDPKPDFNRAEEASKLAQAFEFITEGKDGFNTFIGDRGLRLSGGQRQRIALARALYHQPELLILDEATSALDSASEKLIQKALENLRGNLAVVAVAHRLSTVRNADVIYYIHGGEIQESGTHEELMATGTFYKKLVFEQASERDIHI